MFDYLVDHVVGSIRGLEQFIDPREPGHPRSDLMQHLDFVVQKPGHSEGEHERYNAFVEAVLRELGWCTRHSPWRFYYAPDLRVGCRECDGRATSVAGERVFRG